MSAAGESDMQAVEPHAVVFQIVNGEAGVDDSVGIRHGEPALSEERFVYPALLRLQVVRLEEKAFVPVDHGV